MSKCIAKIYRSRKVKRTIFWNGGSTYKGMNLLELRYFKKKRESKVSSPKHGKSMAMSR